MVKLDHMTQKLAVFDSNIFNNNRTVDFHWCTYHLWTFCIW